ncbi:RNaseH domain-containing protein [Burkholderia sp. LMG 21824]|uniref:RNaseH domain-containing protein n=1 Tax=Burkholderia sp. LMG 21824 TaxID=3158172 RepID=UPI003C2BED9D
MSIEYKHISMALQFNAIAPAFDSEMVSIGWTDDAAQTLSWIASQAASNAKQRRGVGILHLPFVTLSTRLQLIQPGWVSLSRDVETKRIMNSTEILPFGYVHADQLREQDVVDAVAHWIDGPLTHFAIKFGVPIVGIEQMRNCVAGNKLLRFERHRIRLFPWGTVPKGQPSRYHVTAGEIASMLEGVEIFPDLGSVFRVVDSPQFDAAELMTLPTTADGHDFSLVCSVSIQTVPGTSQPIIYLRFSRRRWATSLVKNPFKIDRIGGFVFAPGQRPGLAFRFDLDYVRNTGWKTDQAYEQLESALSLTPGYSHEKIVWYPSGGDTRALVMQRAGLAETPKSRLKAGVPVADQLAGFERIVERLSSHGFEPFSDFFEVKRNTPRLPRLSVLRAPLILSQLLEATTEEDNDEEPSTPELLDKRVLALTKRSLSDWFGSKRPVLDRRYSNVAGVVSEMVHASGIADDNERRTLCILVQSPLEKVWMQTVARMMLGKAVDVLVGEIPIGAHGPREVLEGSEPGTGKMERMTFRCNVWANFAKSLGLGPRPMFLIQADDWYSVDGKRLPDDSINKPACRRTLATELGATVQYLLPARAQKLDNYLMRLQAAILDLVYGHSGCVMGLVPAIERAFPKEKTRPRQVVAIGSVSLFMGERRGTVVAAVRIDSKDSRPMIRLAHLESEPIYTDWMRFDEGLGYVARRTRLELPNKKNAPTFFQKFLAEVLDEAAERDPNSVVFIDSTRNASMWTRLTDRAAKFGQQALDGETGGRENWSGLRIIRVRDQAPTMVALREHDITHADGNRLAVATSVMRLFSVSCSLAPTYWSYGPPGQTKRGTSCYRSMLLPDRRGGGASLFTPQYGQHQTPRGTEFVILQAQPDDDPDQLAIFSELLRIGVPQARGDIWVKVPSPLFAIDKLGDYMRY